MRMTIDECLEEAQRTDDSLDLAQTLRRFAAEEGFDPETAYYMREAATNLEAHFALTRSMAAHLAISVHKMRHPAVDKTVVASAPEWKPQAAVAIDPNERMLRFPEVEAMIGLKKSALFNLIRAGKFPRPTKVGRSALYPESTIKAWIAEKMAQRSQTTESAEP